MSIKENHLADLNSAQKRNEMEDIENRDIEYCVLTILLNFPQFPARLHNDLDNLLSGTYKGWRKIEGCDTLQKIQLPRVNSLESAENTLKMNTRAFTALEMSFENHTKFPVRNDLDDEFILLMYIKKFYQQGLNLLYVN